MIFFCKFAHDVSSHRFFFCLLLSAFVVNTTEWKAGKLIFTCSFSLLSFFSTRGSLFVQWFVSSISKDIADFYLHFRDGRNKVLLEKTLPYDTRIGNISTSQLEAIEFDKTVDVCILAKNSDGVILNFDESQCTRMPSSFNAIMTKYNRRPSTFFKIFEMDKKNLGRNAIALASSSTKILTNLSLIAIISVSWIFIL